MRSRTTVALGVLLVATAVTVTTEILPVGLLPQMAVSLAVPEGVAGLLVTLYAVLVAALAVPLTLATRRVPRKPLLLATLVLLVVSNAVVAVAPSFPVVAAGRVLGGIAHALFFTVVNVYATLLVPPDRQGRAISIVLAGAPVGYVAAVPLATALGAAVGWRAAFGALGALLALLVVVVALLLPARTPPAAAPGSARLGGVGIVAVANVLGFLGHYALYTYVAVLLIRSGVGERSVSGVLFVLAAAGLIGLTAGSRVIDRRPRAALLVTLLVAAVGVLLTWAAGSPVLTVAAAGVWVLAFGALPPFFAAATIRAAGPAADVGAAVNNAMSNVGIAAGAAVGAALIGGPGVAALAPVSAACFLATVAVVVVGRRAFPSRGNPSIRLPGDGPS